MKKTIAKHILWFFGLVAVWIPINFILDIKRDDDWIFRGWRWDEQAGILLLLMFIAYIVVCVIYWAVKTIWFNKDKD